MPVRGYTFDALLQLADGAQPITGGALLAGSAKSLDVGACQYEALLVITPGSVKVSAGDELYRIVVQGSNSPSFASGIENLAIVELGATAARLGGASATGAGTTVLGQRFVGIVNEVGDTIYRYLRLYNAHAGTSPTISYNAFLSNLPGR